MESLNRVSVVHFGSFEVNLESGELRKSGVRIRLQQQPLKVLEALLKRPGQIVTREDLRTCVWPKGAIASLRQCKTNQPQQKPALVRGRRMGRRMRSAAVNHLLLDGEQRCS